MWAKIIHSLKPLLAAKALQKAESESLFLFLNGCLLLLLPIIRWVADYSNFF
jgi:hypothetical protein